MNGEGERGEEKIGVGAISDTLHFGIKIVPASKVSRQCPLVQVCLNGGKAGRGEEGKAGDTQAFK
jgi:hypothetical protein